MDFRFIIPRGGKDYAAFEELSYLLLAQDKAGVGIPNRREGAGGDAGLEGGIFDREGRVLIGIQAKFYKDKLERDQWRGLSSSIEKALQDNAVDGVLREIVVTLPRNLNQTERKRWNSLTIEWGKVAQSCGYQHAVTFSLWDESRLRGLLLQPANRGLLLYYFEVRDLDAARCAEKTQTSLANLGNRYQPELHTPTEAEDSLHTFLRSERSRQQFLDFARERITEAPAPGLPDEAWGTEILASHRAAVGAWQVVLTLFGDGLSLPASFASLKGKLDAAVSACRQFAHRLYEVTPAGLGQTEDDSHHGYRQNTPVEQAYYGARRWGNNLSSLSQYLDEHAQADLPCFLLTGKPGTGKTQVLAEICSRYAEEGGVVLFREGALFTSDEYPWKQFLDWTINSIRDIRDFLATFSAIAAATGLPGLICIDALNETPNRHLWQKGLNEFAAEILPFKDHVKLIVSCRSDYLRQTLPQDICERRSPHWYVAEHEGLGVNVFEALPKYLRTFGVRGVGMPPLAAEFENPLFLRTFCEAFAGQTPPPGSVSLRSILKRYAERKADLIHRQIDCDANKVLGALHRLAKAMLDDGRMRLPEIDAQAICEHLHNVTGSTHSLYRALLAEDILMEIPAEDDVLGPRNDVRFTYERIWDYFLSHDLLPEGKAPSSALLDRLSDPEWRDDNSGVVSLLTLRLAEEGRGELCDLIAPNEEPPYDLLEAFLDSLPWRTAGSVTERTRELYEESLDPGIVGDRFDALLRFAPNPAHPWNAHQLHELLGRVPMADRDREWTLWINNQLTRLQARSPLHTLLNWAEHGHLELLPSEHIFLLATVLAWCLSTTSVKPRERVAVALTRLLVGRLPVATQIVERFLPLDDPYVQEYVLLAAAGAAQHASNGDRDLEALAATVHERVFAGGYVPPHLHVRHYATEICQQAQQKGVLPPGIKPASFRPPFRSRWPKVWSSRKVDALEIQLQKNRASSHHAHALFASVEPGPLPPYGNFGRYVLGHAVGHFDDRRLRGAPFRGRRGREFNAQTAKRYILQRIFGIGWDATAIDEYPSTDYRSDDDRVERLSKKYQWIALHEFPGHLADHYVFTDYSRVVPFQTAADISSRGLLDPYVAVPHHGRKDFAWQFKPTALPWWQGHYTPLPRPLSHREQFEKSAAPDRQDPSLLLALKDDDGIDWLCLSCLHNWYEPQPFWLTKSNAPYVGVNWAVQSYLVKPGKSAKLFAHLQRKDFPGRDSHWMDEPEFERPLAELRSYPTDQKDLRRECELDHEWHGQHWRTGAWSTTCRLEEEEKHKRYRGGSFPSPQLATLGGLRWTGQDFDFAPADGGEVVVRHHGAGFKGACVVRREVMLEWLRRKNLQLAWRCFRQSYRYHEAPAEKAQSRFIWAAYSLTANGEIMLAGGGTCTVHNGLGPEEPLPWQK